MSCDKSTSFGDLTVTLEHALARNYERLAAFEGLMDTMDGSFSGHCKNKYGMGLYVIETVADAICRELWQINQCIKRDVGHIELAWRNPYAEFFLFDVDTLEDRGYVAARLAGVPDEEKAEGGKA